MKKIALIVFGLFIALYVALAAYFFYTQNSRLFKPEKLEAGHSYPYTFNYQERWFDIEDGVRIHAIHAKADSSKGLVLFYHGNRGNDDTDTLKFTLFLDLGYDVLYPDYREYGQSTGELWNEEDLVGDMLLVYKEMKKEYDEQDIIALGYSMGSGVVAQVAAANDPREVVIWTPYYSMVDMKNTVVPYLPDFLVRYPLRTDLAIQNIEEPITIFYAGEDEVLPINRSLKLTEFLDDNDEYFILEGQKHGYVYHNPVLQQKMAEILNN